MNSALSGVLLEAGEHTVEFRKSGGWYTIISWLHVVLYGWIALMLLTLVALGVNDHKVPQSLPGSS